MSKNTRTKLISSIITASNKQFGSGTTQILSSGGVTSKVLKTISTGSPELDMILARDLDGNYGMPVGRIVGISGMEASGKTTLLMMLMKNVQRMGGLAILVETEHAFDPAYAKLLGINLDELVLSQPDYLEQGLDLMMLYAKQFRQAKAEFVAHSKEPWSVPMFIGFDSIAGVPTKSEFESTSFESNAAIALHARKLSGFFRTINGLIARQQICLVCTNQLKTDMNVKWGNKDTELGGRALKFHATVRLDIRRRGFIKETKDGDPIGIETTVKTVKNKTMPPYKSVVVPIIFGEGISYSRSLFNALLSRGIIEKKKKTYSLEYKIKGKNGIKHIKISEVGLKNFKNALQEKIQNSPLSRQKLERLLYRHESKVHQAG